MLFDDDLKVAYTRADSKELIHQAIVQHHTPRYAHCLAVLLSTLRGRNPVSP